MPHITGVGSSFVILAAFTAAVTNFPARQHGKAVALLEATQAGFSPMMLALVYALIFSNHNYEHPENQNAQGFMLFLAIGAFVAYILCALFLRIYPTVEQDKDEKQTVDDPKVNHESVNHNVDEESKLIPKEEQNGENVCNKYTVRVYRGIKTSTAYLFKVEMQCFFWSFGLMTSVGSVFFNNGTVILESFHHNSYEPYFTVLLPVSSIVCTLLIAPISDYLANVFPRIFFVIIFCNLFAILHIILVFFSSSIVVLMTATVFVGMNSGFTWNLMVAILAETLGIENFSRNLGTVLFSFIICNSVTQYIFALFYDLYADSEHICYGRKCYQWTFGISSIFLFIASIFLIIIYKRKCKNH